jgi:adenylyltransferase/sulfurtransferase
MTEDIYAELETTPKDVKARMDHGDSFLLVDVREPNEFAICRIEGAKLIPLREVPANLAQIEAAEDVVVYCHHGMRSLDAAAWLRSQGVAGVKSMSGGIERWSAEIDAGVPRY